MVSRRALFLSLIARAVGAARVVSHRGVVWLRISSTHLELKDILHTIELLLVSTMDELPSAPLFTL